MKKVALLGDSIRLIGYGTKLPEITQGEFEIWQPEDNSRFVQYVLRQIFDYSKEIDEAEIVHFNSGEWDICRLYGDSTFTTPEYYVSQLERITDILQKKGKKVVFATTTPVKEANKYNFNEDIEYFNKIAVEALTNKGVVINDLYSVVMEDLENNIREDNLHLSEVGIIKCAEATKKVLQSL